MRSKPGLDNRRPSPSTPQSRKVVYLFGAGASHACAKLNGSSTGILMDDLAVEINKSVREIVKKEYPDNTSVRHLANEVILQDTEIEQVITFLETSGSRIHRDFARHLREVFRSVLHRRLEDIVHELQTPPIDLYSAVIDMHDVPECNEELAGILTLNYDHLLEDAIRSLKRTIDYGIGSLRSWPRRPVKVLKLHGSFDWVEEWPITRQHSGDGEPLWIPPGIQKAKERYPFSILWGKARELLDCDILRIVGCRLTANDWDLVSMLFTTQYAHAQRGPYEIEIIDRPDRALDIQARFPYLRVRSLLELDRLGEQIVSEMTTGGLQPYDKLLGQEKGNVVRIMSEKVTNPFFYWLKLKAELMNTELESIATKNGAFERILEAY